MSALQLDKSRLSRCPSSLGEGRRDSFSGSGTVSGTEAGHLPKEATQKGYPSPLEAGHQMGQRWDRPVPKGVAAQIAQRDTLAHQRSTEPAGPKAQAYDTRLVKA
jgi:hypothetical protein